MATNNKKFLVKNGLAVGASGIDVISPEGVWIGATGNLNGATGPEGQQGASGLQGNSGATGIHGASGHQGASGSTGIQGASGFQGASGSTGFQGASGSTGFQGASGSTGFQGASGSTGFTGATGQIGATGETGATGVGLTGATGVDGATGIQGPSGQSSSYYNYTAKTGNQSGDPGSGNLNWNNATLLSSTYLQISHLTNTNVDVDLFLGIININDIIIIQEETDSSRYQKWQVNSTPISHVNSYYEFPVTLLDSGGTGIGNNNGIIVAIVTTPVDGATGYTGATGIQGIQGASGSTGFQGASGATGTQGASGSTGLTGATGIEGTPGIDGATGPQGPQGEIGSDGAYGASGATGLMGETGATGETGTQGASGLQGITGASGLQGASGARGATGLQGNDGAQGASGATGSQGGQGLQGASGATGSQGGQGLQGASGSTGVTGASGATPTTTVYTAASASLTDGVYVSGSVTDIQTFNDGNQYIFTDGTLSGPAWIFNVGFTSVTKFNLVELNIQYTTNSGHTIYVQLYNHNTSTWDSIGSYNGLAGYYQFELAVISSDPYINAGAVSLRLYHSNTGNAGHQTNVDYIAIVDSLQGGQGPQGPRGATGAKGATGNDGATGAQGASGYIGVDGATGQTGATGAGLDGATGPQGSLGLTGATGAGLAGASGTIGVDGATGPTGASGPTGQVAEWTKITSNTNAVVNSQYIADTTNGNFGLTLPSSPNLGDVIIVEDGANWSVNPLTIVANGKTIEGTVGNLVLDVGGVIVYLVYDGNTWQVSATMGAAGASGVIGASGTGLTGATGSRGATGPSGNQGATGPGASGALTQSYINSIELPAILRDISSQFDGRTNAFYLYTDTTNVTTLSLPINLEVIINGLKFKPFTHEVTYPWIREIISYGSRGFDIHADAVTGYQRLVFNNPPFSGSDSVLTVINNKTTIQTTKYPYSAMTIALGD